MLVPGDSRVIGQDEGRSVDLGVVSMRVIAGGEETTGRRFTLAEFSGTAAGAWTVPHLHRAFDESFYVLDGRFVFTLGEQECEATPGTYVLVPRNTAHTITADDGGGRFLTLMVPGGLEDMFFELGQLGADALRDPAARAAVSARYDSIPVPVTLQELQPPEANSPVGGYVMASRCANLLGQARGVRQLDSRVRRSAPRRERRDRHAAAALRRGRREAARSSVGVAGLPLRFAVEIETVVEVDADRAAGQSVSP